MCVSMSWLLALARMILLNTAKRRSMVITTKFRHHKLVASQVFPSLEMSGEQSNSRINWAISCWAAYACNGTPSVRIYNIQRGPYLVGVILLIGCFKCQALILGSGFYFYIYGSWAQIWDECQCGPISEFLGTDWTQPFHPDLCQLGDICMTTGFCPWNYPKWRSMDEPSLILRLDVRSLKLSSYCWHW